MKHGNEFEFAIRMAKGIAGQFGPDCEVVIHDLRGTDTEHSIIAIENGHVTGRSIGDGPSHIVLESLREDPSMIEDRISYLTKTPDGKVLKSSTLFIRDEDGKAIGLMGINYDISMLLAVEDSIRAFTGQEQSYAEPESISRNVADLLDELLEHDIDALILGCTHYPLLRSEIRRLIGDGIRLVNPAYETASELKRLLKEQGLDNDKLRDAGEPYPYRFYVSDEAERFAGFANSVLPVDVKNARIVPIEEF